MDQQQKIEDFLRTVAAAPSSVLLLDYDGTLAPFSLDRQHAAPYSGVTELLQKITDSAKTRLVMITGRDARDVGPLLQLRPSPEVWGCHGLQRMRPDGSCEMAEIPLLAVLGLEDARRWLATHDLEHLTEIKPGSIALHWRALDHAAAMEVRSRTLLGWFPITERCDLKILEFDGGVELRFASLDKGDAVKTILSELAADVPVAYLGDDTTDEHAFRALNGRGLTVLVRPVPRRTSAQFWMRAPEELLSFLSSWNQAITTSTIANNPHPIMTRDHAYR